MLGCFRDCRPKQNIVTDLFIHWCFMESTKWSAFIDNVLSESCLDKPEISCDSSRPLPRTALILWKPEVCWLNFPFAGAGIARLLEHRETVCVAHSDTFTFKQWKDWSEPIFSKVMPFSCIPWIHIPGMKFTRSLEMWKHKALVQGLVQGSGLYAEK